MCYRCVGNTWYGELLLAIHQRLLKEDAALIQLTKKDKSFGWTVECQKLLDQLTEALNGPDIMAYPTDDGEFILDTAGAVWSHGQDGVGHVIAYGSGTLSKPE